MWWGVLGSLIDPTVEDKPFDKGCKFIYRELTNSNWTQRVSRKPWGRRPKGRVLNATAVWSPQMHAGPALAVLFYFPKRHKIIRCPHEII